MNHKYTDRIVYSLIVFIFIFFSWEAFIGGRMPEPLPAWQALMWAVLLLVLPVIIIYCLLEEKSWALLFALIYGAVNLLMNAATLGMLSSIPCCAGTAAAIAVIGIIPSSTIVYYSYRMLSKKLKE